MAVDEWYQRLREESEQFMRENQRQWDQRQREWDEWRRIEDERRRIADERWRIADQEWNHRFYRNINDLRRDLGMPIVSLSGDQCTEENQLKQAVNQLKQAVEIHGGRSDIDQRFKTLEQTTTTTTSFQEESKIEITQRLEHNFEVLTELIRDLAGKGTLAAATSLGKGVGSRLETKNSLNRTPKSDFLTLDDKNQEEVQFHSEQPKPGEEFVQQATESPTSSLSCNLGDSRVMDQLKAIDQGRPTVYQETHATQNSTRDISFSFEIEGVGDPTIFWGINIDSERPTLFKDFRTELDVGAPSQKLLVESSEHPEVISNPLDACVAVESGRLDELTLPEFAMVKWADRRMISVEILGNSVA